MASRAGGGIGLTIFHKVMSANCRETCHFISADDHSVASQAKQFELTESTLTEMLWIR